MILMSLPARLGKVAQRHHRAVICPQDIGLRRLNERLRLDVNCGAIGRRDACIVHPNVEPAPSIHCMSGQRFDLGQLGYITCKPAGLRSLCAQRFHSLRDGLRRARRHDDGCAFAGKSLGNRQPQAACAAGDDGDFVFE